MKEVWDLELGVWGLWTVAYSAACSTDFIGSSVHPFFRSLRIFLQKSFTQSRKVSKMQHGIPIRPYYHVLPIAY
jgi:hypothetical protein